MNTRQANADLENLKVFETLVDTMRTMGSALYPKLKKKIAPSKEFLTHILSAVYSVKIIFSEISKEITDSEFQKLRDNTLLRAYFDENNEKEGKVLVIPIGSNRSFCGDINRKVVDTTEEIIRKINKEGREYVIRPIGKKLNNVFRHLSNNVLPFTVFPEKSFSTDDPSEFFKIAKNLIRFFESEFSSLIIVYTELIDRSQGQGYDTIPIAVKLFPFTDIPVLNAEKPESHLLNLIDSSKLKEFTGLETLTTLTDLDIPLRRELVFDTILSEEDQQDGDKEKLLEHKISGKVISDLIEQYFISSFYFLMLHSLTSINYRRMNSMNQASKSIKDTIIKLNRSLAKERKRIITKNLIEVIAASIQEDELEKQIR